MVFRAEIHEGQPVLATVTSAANPSSARIAGSGITMATAPSAIAAR
jgi:hypothetical protein